MQNHNDNEIVQYLGVKHIINYLRERDGLTRSRAHRTCLQILNVCGCRCACMCSLATWMVYSRLVSHVSAHKERIRSNRVITSIHSREWIYY